MKTRAIILAAGQGKRLLPHTKNLPKCLVRVDGLPILHRQISSLKTAETNNIILVLGFMSDAVKEYVSTQFPDTNFTFVYNPLFKSTNTLYSLALAAKHVQQEEIVLQLNGDVLFRDGVIQRILLADQNSSYAVICRRPCGDEEIKVRFAEDRSISALNKKLKAQETAGEAIGINKFSPDFWRMFAANLQLLKNTHKHEYFEYAIEQTITHGGKLLPLEVKNREAHEIDFPEDLDYAQKLWQKNITLS